MPGPRAAAHYGPGMAGAPSGPGHTAYKLLLTDEQCGGWAASAVAPRTRECECERPRARHGHRDLTPPRPHGRRTTRCACCAGELSGANLEYLQRNTQTLILIGSTDEVRGWVLTVGRPHGDEVL